MRLRARLGLARGGPYRARPGGRQGDPGAARQLRPGSLFVSRAWIWRPFLPDGQPFFPGLAVLLLAGRALATRRGDGRVRLLALVALVTFVMALGPEVRWRGTPLLPGPFALALRVVPLLDAMRHPYTLAVPGLMALGLLAALGLSGGARPLRPGWQAAALALALAEAFGDALPGARRHASCRRSTPSWPGWWRARPAAAPACHSGAAPAGQGAPPGGRPSTTCRS